VSKQIYHLSHIDLDGYGCQYLVSKALGNVKYYNANYGPEVKARINEIISDIENDQKRNADEKQLILITDLNLTTKEGHNIEKEARRLGVELQLLDHHASGANAAEEFEWYELDTTRCASKITYQWLQEKYNFDKENEYKDIVKAINAIDIWQDQDSLFEYGKVMLGMVSGAREINKVMFPNQDREFKLSLIEGAKDRLLSENAPIVLDDELHSIKKAFFISGVNNTKDNLVAIYITKILTAQKDRLIVNYKDYKGILTYSVGNTSIIGNAFLVANEDMDFYMDVGGRGNFSLRSNNKVDVSKMAATIGNGGGHPNASGGKIKDFKNSFVYGNLHGFIQRYIDEMSEKE